MHISSMASRARVMLVGLLGMLFALGCSSNAGTAVDETRVEVASTAEQAAVEPEPSATPEPDEAATAAEQAAVEPEPSATAEVVEAEQAPASDGSPEAQVQTAFAAYRQALIDFDPAAASMLVTPSTIAYYDRLLDLSINATSSELLTTMPLGDGLGVLALRARLGQELLLVADGPQLFEEAVRRGLVGDVVSTTGLDRVEVDGAEALGFLNGVAGFRFELDGDAWLIDLPFSTALIDENEAAFLEGIGGNGATREDLFTLVALGLQTTFPELSEPLSADG